MNYNKSKGQKPNKEALRMGKLEDAPRKAAELVVSYDEKSYLYMVATLSMVAISRAKAVGANPLVEEFRMEEALKAIKADNREYSLDDEEFMVHMVILNPDRTGEDANAVENALSRAYSDLSLRDALGAEKSKLQIEHSRSEDAGRRCLIEHLIGVTDSAANDRPSRKVKKLLVKELAYVISGYISNASEMNEGISWKLVEVDGGDEWRADLFNCCAEPCLSLWTGVKENLSQPRLESLENDLNYEGPVAEASRKSTSLKEELDESLVKMASLETNIEELKQKFAKIENKASQALLDNELLVETNLQLKLRVDELQELLNSAASDKEVTAQIATITKLQLEETQWQSAEEELTEGRCSRHMRELVHGTNGGLRAMVVIIMGVGTMVTDRMPVMNASLSGFAGGALASTVGELLKVYSDRVTMKALREIHLLKDEEEIVDLSGARWPPAPAADELPHPWLAVNSAGSFAIGAICLLLLTHMIRSYKSRMWTVVVVATAMFIGIGAASGHLEKSSFVHFCIRVVGFDLLLMAFSFAIDWFCNRVGSY
ncbi:hypothetical protein CDL15_Pgr026903 [Punica granatum]|uniref:Uncharacterized protein n=1 Tax=Punica granatum TaxID=22663 RepID=A0A218WMU3_PUNGR|nr:hypothetical protein CDL15_Pgr026903 [Punica granatum]